MKEQLRTAMEKTARALADLAPADPAMLLDALPAAGEESRLKTILVRALAGEDEPVRLRVLEEYFGTGPLGPLLKRLSITEIMLNGPESIWYEENGKLHPWEDRFLSPLTYRNFVLRMCRDSEMQTNLDIPFANGHWRGFRAHIAAPPASDHSAVVTLRRHPESPWTLRALQDADWAPSEAILCLRQLLERKKNFLIVGCTGSGKTSVLNACLKELPDSDRVVVIEDTSELVVSNSVSAKLLTRHDPNGLLREIAQADLVRQSLRMRPDRIVMGEIRGPEAKDLLMALATGHSGCMATLHADSARQALLRLEMLIQMGAAQWNLQAVRSLIQLSLDSIVVVRRTPEGQRRLEGVYRLASLEEMGFLVEKIA